MWYKGMRIILLVLCANLDSRVFMLFSVLVVEKKMVDMRKW